MKRIVFLLLMCLAATVYGQTPRTVKLKATSGNLAVRNFRVTGVVDDREDTTNIGSMRAGTSNKTTSLNLTHGAAHAVAAFITSSVQQPPGKDSIELHLVELNIKERARGQKEQADLTSKYAFFKNGKKIIDYSGSAYVQTGADASPYIGKLLSQSIEQVLKEFDTWWPANRHLYDESKRNQLTVNVSLKRISNDPDQIVHNMARPLTMADFKGTPDKLSKASAATYSGFSLNYQMDGNYNGNIATIEVMPYFEQSKSWMKPAGRIPYVLQHEQLHFDIATIKTYEFIIAIKNYPFTVADFKQQIAGLQMQYNKEMEQMQADYDAETSHGIFKKIQNMWEARIKSDLKAKAALVGL